MKSLTHLLAGAVMGVGLAACVSDAPPEPKPSAPIVKVPTNVDYNAVAWDRAYFDAIGNHSDEEINLFGLQFESYLQSEKRVRVVRKLSF